MRGLRGKRAVVTGAGQGIGRGIAERLRDEGVRVLAVDMKAEGLDGFGPDPDLAVLTQDVTAPDAPARIVAACREAFGGMGILVNNAGLGAAPPLHETTDEVLDRYLAVNLRATLRLSRDALPDLLQSHGAIVNIASSIALAGYRGWGAYAPAKAGVVGATRQMAASYGPQRLRVNAVAPGITRTPGTAARIDNAEFRARILSTKPLPGTAEPSDIAAAVAFLASDEARFITGQVLAVDGGQSSSVFAEEGMIQAYAERLGARGRTL
ncbi:SDR family NAD(P)-dependent oxidoreductase [Pseudochelatococcus sp. B33]